MSFSKYLEQSILDKFFADGDDLYLALFTDDPDEGEEGDEVDKDGYSRKKITFEDASESQPAETKNDSTVEFDTAEEDWGTIKAVGIYDDDDGGELYVSAVLDKEKEVTENDVFNVPSGNLTIQLD